MNFIKNILFIILFTVTTSVIAQSVYTTKTGEKYHKSSCKYLRYSKKEYTLVKAVQLGFTACSVCKPTKSNTAVTNANGFTSSNQSSTPSRSTTAKQCTGKTQAGKRCKRTTKNSNGRCYQH
ncbi:hypothetical protein [Algibacter sp. L3A6]|uniref:hypothetical protein n=1 Tax=Algibacter sp. L3A6 TaxID=2686366 RepID=UPI00131CDCAA|nr:hypothetical protein [Algibacter sp. L3A6]